ncbi:hypothetical protein Pen01_56410 [Phytomonospora endophytica]|nr:hypothetical protein Pen01_56410 [Phytomonospora endophytica]
MQVDAARSGAQRGAGGRGAGTYTHVAYNRSPRRGWDRRRQRRVDLAATPCAMARVGEACRVSRARPVERAHPGVWE